jgi:Raf kinase inhibitor-like YbhB/YbcL family protein
MKPIRRWAIVLVMTVGLVLILSACGGGDAPEQTGDAAEAAGATETVVDQSEYMLGQVVSPTMEISSSTITSRSLLPQEATCEGEDVSPQLSWTGAPEGTQSFAIIANDSDAEEGDFAHWVVYSIPATVTEIQEGAPAGETLPNGAKQGINDDENVQYNGPCPPPIVPKFTQVTGSDLPHRYYFKVYALDTAIDLPEGVNKYGLLRKMDGRILATGELMRRYVAKKREASTQ